MQLLATDRFAELRAPAHWQTVDFISDLHLQASEPATFEAWRHYLERPPIERADALFILGDLFEVWVGDDVLAQTGTIEHDFWRTCVQVIRTHAERTPVYFMVGNRDFLLGSVAAQACGMQLLSDPTALDFLGHRWLLSHGDALCLADTDYMRFREQVRHPQWQRTFLERPLEEREAIARDLRQQSEARKQSAAGDPHTWADVDHFAAQAWLLHAQAQTLIHGHTHRPAEHPLGGGLQRVVLSDWEVGGQHPRAEVLRIGAQGMQRLTMTPR